MWPIVVKCSHRNILFLCLLLLFFLYKVFFIVTDESRRCKNIKDRTGLQSDCIVVIFPFFLFNHRRATDGGAQQDARTKRILPVSLDLFFARTDSFIVTQLHWLPASGVELLVKPSELRTARLDPPGEQKPMIMSAVKSIRRSGSDQPVNGLTLFYHALASSSYSHSTPATSSFWFSHLQS